ncbi:MAG TPA: peptide chain release factor N(5)-glutamine methyltransferase [Polyangiaceae bacterium]|nr:peptide chain release factor N(5)-glutamine methyltransferase [Polyangiaceae bacterium]
MTHTERPGAAPAASAAGANEVWTIGRVLRWATEDLGRRGGNDSPRLDAELLLGYATGLDRVRLIVDSSRPLSPDELTRFRELLVRRRRLEPIAYILGEREFYGLRFSVNQHVLIPRPDTEFLVNVALERTQALHLFGRALDVCTGSGCVAVAFATQRPTWHVTGSDISAEALVVARKNALRHGAVWNVDFRHSDLLADIPAEPRFDLITANPPYIPDDEVLTLAADIKNFEPHAALCGGADGLSIARRLVKAARGWLAPGGVLAMEVGAGQAERVAKGLAGYGFVDVSRTRDYGGIERVVSGRWPG